VDNANPRILKMDTLHVATPAALVTAAHVADPPAPEKKIVWPTAGPAVACEVRVAEKVKPI
jgi:hypothetical protein